MGTSRSTTRVATTALIALLVLCAGCESTDNKDAADSGKDSHHSSVNEKSKPIGVQLQDAVDASNADSPKATKTGQLLKVQWKVSDNLNNGAIQGGIAIDVFDMSQRIVKTGAPVRQVTFEGTFPLVDKYGKKSVGTVFRATLSMTTLKKIQYDNIDTTSLDLVNELASGPTFLLPDLQD